MHIQISTGLTWTRAVNRMNQSQSHSPSASSVFNSRSFSRTAGGREDSGGSAILVGLDRGNGSVKKSGKFRHSVGEANVTALYCFRTHSPLAEIEKVTNVTWHARRHFPSVQHDHNCLKIYCSRNYPEKTLFMTFSKFPSWSTWLIENFNFRQERMSTIIPKQYASCVTEKVCHATLQIAFFPRTIFLFRDQKRRNISPRGNGSVSGYQTTFFWWIPF